MSKKILKEITKLNKVEEISVCTKENPPANRLREFEIIKDSLSKSEFEDLFEELAMPEYGEFTSYLNAWLEDDVNQVAYKAFIDALFASLMDISYDKEMTKEDKASKMKETFDSFIAEYNNSVITKSEDGKVILNIEKENKDFNESELIKSKNIIQKQEKKVDILEKIKKFINGLESQEVIEEVKKSEEQPEVEQEEPQAEAVAEPEVAEEAKPEDAQIEEPAEEAEVVAEEPLAEEQPEEVAEEVVEEPAVVEPEVIEEPVEKSESQEPAEEVNEEIVKAQETISSLESKIQELTKAQKQNEVKLEKAELTKSVQEKFSGLAGTTEEIVEHIFSINKSELPLETKDMVLKSLETLSSKNIELTKEIGTEAPAEIVKTEQEILKSKVEKLMKEEGISENKAFAVVKGTMSLEKAKGKCKK